jgi:very-short-patch-repair endonuclease
MKIIEIDGYGAHSTPEQLRADLLRQNMLMDLGWEIRRFSVDRIRSEPEIVRAEIIDFIND